MATPLLEMSRALPLVLLSALLVPAVGCTCVHGSGVEQRERFALEGFDRIESEGLFDVWITVGAPFSVEAVADDNIMPMVEVLQHGHTLMIDAHGGISPSIRPRVEVSLPTLRDAELGSDGRIAGLAGGDLRVHNPFMSDVTLEGSLDTLELLAGDDVDALGLTVRVAHLQLEPHADVAITVTEELVAHGRGQLRYNGSPTVAEIGPKIDVTR